MISKHSANFPSRIDAFTLREPFAHPEGMCRYALAVYADAEGKEAVLKQWSEGGRAEDRARLGSEAHALKIALLHDMEERFSGDILTPFKHYNEDVLNAIRKVNEEMIQLVFEDLPPKLREEFVGLWNQDIALTTREAQIVKVADKLSLLSKCYEEIKIGNEYFKPIYEREVERLAALPWPWWQEIKEHILPRDKTPIQLSFEHLH